MMHVVLASLKPQEGAPPYLSISRHTKPHTDYVREISYTPSSPSSDISLN